VYEEEYLVASVGRLIERVNGLHDEVARLLSGLMRRGMREQAKRVEEGMQDMASVCEKAKTDVWGETKKVEEEPSTYDVDGLGRPTGADGVFWDSQQETSKREAPEVKLWKVNELF
jgi:elongator complex protein 1